MTATAMAPGKQAPPVANFRFAGTADQTYRLEHPTALKPLKPSFRNLAIIEDHLASLPPEQIPAFLSRVRADFAAMSGPATGFAKSAYEDFLATHNLEPLTWGEFVRSVRAYLSGGSR